jgi:sugar/nucleoside kinase (ribokinase family)
MNPMPPPRALFVGRSTLDALYRLDCLPEEDTKVYARAFHAAPGGPALNAAITHSLLGGEAMLVSAVGRGPWAAVVRAELARHGIALLDLAAGTDYETPLVTALLADSSGSRTAVNPPLAQTKLQCLSGSWEAASGVLPGGPPPVILSDGFHLAETLPFLAACRAAGSVLCLDGGSWKPGTSELAPLLTVAICSERFQIPGLGDDPASIFAWFAARGVPSVALTRGAKPILGWEKRSGWERGRRFEIEVEKVAAADTLGAGDVLHGAFCYFYARQPEFEPALRRASRIATLSCQSLGTQAWAAQSVPEP